MVEGEEESTGPLMGPAAGPSGLGKSMSPSGLRVRGGPERAPLETPSLCRGVGRRPLEACEAEGGFHAYGPPECGGVVPTH